MINSFRHYLVEETKLVYFTFGRMNPPTIGHEKLLTKLAANARTFPYRVYLSQSQDPKKNPLQHKEKVKFARKMFPKHARQIMLDTKIKNVFDVMVKLYNEGFKRAVMVVGSDRVREFDVLLNKYNGKKGRHGFYNFERIQIISAGDRDPDADDVSGMSASKMRKAASDNDFTSFSQGMPKAMSNADTKAIYNAVRKGMGLKEQSEFKNHIQLEPISEIRENYVQGNLFSPGDVVVIKETGELGRIKHLGSNYVIVEGSGNQYRKWIDSVEKMTDDTAIEVAPFSVQKESLNEDYYAGLSKSTADKRKAHFKKHAKMDDDNPRAYKKAPGDATAKTKPSKHTKRFKQMFGEQDAADMAKKRIEREKQQDKRRHDRMMDRARLRDTLKKNRETK